MFKGESRCAVDDKGRFNFPAKFREEMGETFVVTRWTDNCLIAMPQQQWERVSELMNDGTLSHNRKIKRLLFGGAEDVVLDKQGRISLSSELRGHAGIIKEISVLGVGNAVEIWDVAKLEELDSEDMGEEIALGMEELGI